MGEKLTIFDNIIADDHSIYHRKMEYESNFESVCCCQGESFVETTAFHVKLED